MITFESILNFERGQRVKINPKNHGFKQLGSYVKIMDREGRVVKVHEVIIEKLGYGEAKRTGKISVLWDGDTSHKTYDYKNLQIVKTN